MRSVVIFNVMERVESEQPFVRGNGATEQEAVMERIPKTGDHVVVVDELRIRHDGLITVYWGAEEPNMCANVVYVSADESKEDPYGRQIERLSSCQHKSGVGNENGRYWCWPDEA